jgi:hypothetical protein
MKQKIYTIVILSGLFLTVALSGQAQTLIPGTSLYWELVGNTLTITGTGAIPDYAYADNQPWGPPSYSRTDIYTIVLPDGLTGIGNHAFDGCTNLSSVNIPSGVTAIGEYAFNYCPNLSAINIPSGVTSIGRYAFNGTGLTSINIPEGVTTIGEYAFSGCESLASINIPASITVFNGAFSTCISLTSVNIAEGVTTIGEHAFPGCTSLASVHIPASVTTIGEGAFFDCTNLTSVDMAEGVTTIGTSAFAGSGLTSIHIPASVTTIGDGAFYECTSLASVDMEEGVTTIGASAFIGCTSLASVHIPASVTTIGDGAFYECTSLASVDMEEGVMTIGGYAFYGCTSLASVDIVEGVTTIGDGAFSESGLTSVHIPASVTTIGYEAFAECTSLASVDMEEGVTTIGYGAFSDCTSLTSVDIPASVTTIEDGAFALSGLEEISVHWPDPSTVTFGTDVFYGLTPGNITLYIPEGTDAAYSSSPDLGSFSIEVGYTVTFAALAGGSASASPTTTAPGTPVTLTFAPAPGYELVPDGVSAFKTGDQLTTVALSGAGLSRTFTMPAHDVMVSASFHATTDQTAVNAAKALVEGATFAVDSVTANTEAAVRAWLTPRINALAGFGATGVAAVTDADIATVGFTAATDGTDGSFDFTLTLSSGTGFATVAGLSVTIRAVAPQTLELPVVLTGTILLPDTTEDGNAVVYVLDPRSTAYARLEDNRLIPMRNGEIRLTASGIALPATVFTIDIVLPPPSAPVLRTVVVPAVSGAVTDPPAGTHFIESGEDFVFILAPAPGSAAFAAMPVVRTGRTVEPDGIMSDNGDGSYTVRVPSVRQTVELSIDVPSALDAAADPARVLSTGSELRITASAPGEAQVYTLGGVRIKTFRYPAGETVAMLPAGHYVVVAGGMAYRVIIR